MGLVSIGLIIFFMIDPERGLSDGAQTMAPSVSWKEDVKSLANNRSFVLATMGFTCVTFSVGKNNTSYYFRIMIQLSRKLDKKISYHSINT